MLKLKGAIFDLDGTLLDSMPIWESVADDFLLSQGIKPNKDVREAVQSMSIQQVCGHFCSEYGLALGQQEIIAGINRLVEDFYFNHAPLKDGVAEMLEQLKSRGIKMCVATATDRHLVEGALKRNKIMPYFERIFTCTEVQAGKDQPDIFFQALDFLGTDIKETMIFEDALYAIKTAKEAGFTVTALFDESARAQQDEIKNLADYYYKSVIEWNARNV